jgi:hypothetical protein
MQSDNMKLIIDERALLKGEKGNTVHFVSKVEVKVKVALEDVMKTQRGNKGTALIFL